MAVSHEIQYFLGANSPAGFYSLYSELLPPETANAIYILKGGPGCGKSTLMRRVAQQAAQAGEAVEYILCSGDPDSLDAVVLPRLGAALVDGTAPHVVEPKYPGAVEQYVNLGDCYDRAGLRAIRGEILTCMDGYKEHYQRAYRCLDAAAEIQTDVRAMLVTPALEEKLAAYRETLTQEQRIALAQATKELKEYQDAPSPKEDLEKIPLLRREDINPEPEKLILEEREEEGVKVLFHNIFTSGIGYVKVLFNTDRIPQEDMVYAGLLKAVLGAVSTKHYSYGELADEINLNSGGVNFSIVSYPSLEDPDQFTGMFAGTARVLYEKLDFGFSILGEILTSSVLDDEKRLLEIINETKSRAQMRLNSAGHSAAVARATSYFSPSSAYGDVTGGIAFYQFLEDLAKNFEERKKTLIEKLKETAKRLFTTDNLTVSFTADEKGYGEMKQSLKLLTGILPETGGERYTFTCDKENKNEGFMTSSQVNYVARCGSFAESGLPYTGALRTLKVILGYDYLWLNVRVKGGAYGVMNGAGRTGEGYFVSYRDPNLKETNQVFENVVKYLEEFDADERDMTKYVIGTISDLDVPLLAPYKGSKADAAYFSHLTDEMLKKEREEILKATKEDIRALAPVIREILSTGSFCVIGNAEKIRENQELFGEVKNLFN